MRVLHQEIGSAFPGANLHSAPLLDETAQGGGDLSSRLSEERQQGGSFTERTPENMIRF